MTIGSLEHEEMIRAFKENHRKFGSRSLRYDLEPRDCWRSGHIFQDGEANELFVIFSAGYSVARIIYMNQ